MAAVLQKFVTHIVHEAFHGFGGQLAQAPFVTVAVAVDAHMAGGAGPVAERVVFQLVGVDDQARFAQHGLTFQNRFALAVAGHAVRLQKSGGKAGLIPRDGVAQTQAVAQLGDCHLGPIEFSVRLRLALVQRL